MVLEREPSSFDELFEEALPQLRRLAHGYIRGERDGHTLQTTALVHEAWLALGGKWRTETDDPAALRGALARVMRHVLVDHARKKLRESGLHPSRQVALEEAEDLMLERPVYLLEVHEAIEELVAAEHRRPADVMVMRYFGGLSHPEIAASLRCSVRTVENDWALARAWLRRFLSNGDVEETP